jgi:hypothetical protein
LASDVSVPAVAEPNFYRPIPGFGNLEPKPVTVNEPAPPALWSVVPSRGISLHEIAGEHANVDGRSSPHVDPPRPTEAVAHPLKALSDPAVELRPLTEESPLSLESAAGTGKAGPRS